MTWEEIRAVVQSYGFEILTEENAPEMTYAGNKKFLMNTVYKPKLFTVRKPLNSADN